MESFIGQLHPSHPSPPLTLNSHFLLKAANHPNVTFLIFLPYKRSRTVTSGPTRTSDIPKCPPATPTPLIRYFPTFSTLSLAPSPSASAKVLYSFLSFNEWHFYQPFLSHWKAQDCYPIIHKQAPEVSNFLALLAVSQQSQWFLWLFKKVCNLEQGKTDLYSS